MNFKMVRFRPLPKFLIFALLGLILLQSGPVLAKIYKYKDDQGKTHFTDDASKIPMKYRKQGSVKRFREVQEPGSASLGSKGSSSPASAGGGQQSGILRSSDIGLIKRAISVFEVGKKMGKQYENLMPNFPNGQAAVTAIQSALPLKEGLAADLEGTKVPELKSALSFLKQSIASDQNEMSIGSGLQTRIASIFARLASEGKQQAAIIKQLEQAIKTSEKKKEEAKKKKEEEAKKKAEEEKKKAEEEKKQAEEDSGKKVEKESKNQAQKNQTQEEAELKAEAEKKKMVEELYKKIFE